MREITVYVYQGAGSMPGTTNVMTQDAQRVFDIEDAELSKPGVHLMSMERWRDLRTIEYMGKECRDLRATIRECVREIYGRMELKPCWYSSGDVDDDGDCANWSNCLPECPIVRLRTLAGIEGQDDGNLPKE